jgi:hypothetical protein
MKVSSGDCPAAIVCHEFEMSSPLFSSHLSSTRDHIHKPENVGQNAQNGVGNFIEGDDNGDLYTTRVFKDDANVAETSLRGAFM